MGEPIKSWRGKSRGIRKALSLARSVIRTQATYPGLNHDQDLASSQVETPCSVMKAPPGKEIGLGSVSSQPAPSCLHVGGWLI